MPTFTGEPQFQHDAQSKVGVLVTNLGSPDDADTSSVRRYLAEFLLDPRVVEVPRFLWRIILHGVILRFRPRKSANAYRKVWTQDGSPLIVISNEQKDGIRQRLRAQFGDNIEVELAMRYGSPSIPDALEKLNRQNVRRLLVLPLYPQYCAVTVASTFDAVTGVYRNKRWVPEFRMINQYHDHPEYIQALAKSVRGFWSTHGRGEKLLMSFHGIPQRYLLNGDPYFCQSHKSARLLAAALELDDTQWTLSFQSRLGREEWLRPYTSDVIEQWAADGLQKIDTICPGFSADCLETLEEMVMQYGDEFKSKGGGELRYIPCLNANDDHLDFLSRLATQHMHPWLDDTIKNSATSGAATAARAQALGAQQ